MIPQNTDQLMKLSAGGQQGIQFPDIEDGLRGMVGGVMMLNLSLEAVLGRRYSSHSLSYY